MTTTPGQILEVNIVPLGSTLDGDHSEGDTLLTLDSVDDFPEDTGEVWIDEAVYTYTSVDRVALTMTIDPPLAADYPEGESEKVLNWPRQDSKWAMVEIQDADEPVSALVPYDLYDRIDDGVRDPEEQEDVLVEMRGGDLTVVDVRGQEPIVYSRFLDRSIPDVGPDGVPPPQVTGLRLVGGIGALFASWSPVENSDFVIYDVYLSDEDLPVESMYFAGYTDGSSIAIRDLWGTPLEYGVTYFVRIVAWDSDGSGEASDSASAQMMQVTGPDVAANYVYAGEVLANQVTGGTFQSDLLLSGKIKTASGGARVELGAAGVKVFGPAGDERTTLGSDGVSSFRGSVEASDLTVTGDAALRGQTEISKGGQILLSGGTVASPSMPTVTSGWLANSFTGHTAYFADKTNVTVHSVRKKAAGGYLVGVSYEENGTGYKRMAFISFDASRTFVSAVNSGPIFNAAGGVAIRDLLCFGDDPATNTVVRLTEQGSYWLLTVEGGGSSFLYTSVNTAGQPPKLGTDGTYLYVAEINSSNNKIRVSKYNVSTGTPVYDSRIESSESVFTPATYGPVRSVQVGSFDLGASRYMVALDGSGSAPRLYHALNSSGTYVGADGFAMPDTGIVTGMWDGSNFWSLANDFVLYKHEAKNTATWSPETWWASFTWRNAGNDYETQQSPQRSFTMRARSRIIVTTPSIPYEGGLVDPDAIGVFLGKTGSPPARTAMWLQGESATNTLTITAPVWSGANPPASNGFPPSTTGKIVSASGYIELKGDGSGRLGPHQWDAAGNDLTDTGWIVPTLTGGWADYGSPYSPAAYRRVGKRVYLRGLVKDGSFGSANPIFTLPAGFRPGGGDLIMDGSVQSRTISISNLAAKNTGAPDDNVTASANSHTHGMKNHTHSISAYSITNPVPTNMGSRVDVMSDGRVHCAADGGSWVSLSNISFFVD